MSVISLQKIHRVLKELGYANGNKKRSESHKAYQTYVGGYHGVYINPFPFHNWSISKRIELAEAMQKALQGEGVSSRVDAATRHVFVSYSQGQ